jgi:hypothetical protein
VLSHWVLDWLVHLPDMPLVPGGGPKLGLALWLHPAMAQTLELLCFIAGVLVYLKCTRPSDRRGRWLLVALIACLSLIQFANASGSPPPSVNAVAWVGEAQWLFVAWGYWVDRHRAPAAASGAAT